MSQKLAGHHWWLAKQWLVKPWLVKPWLVETSPPEHLKVVYAALHDVAWSWWSIALKLSWNILATFSLFRESQSQSS